MRYFPILIDLAGRLVVIAGAGEAALQKVRLVLKSEARVRVVGEGPHGELVGLAGRNRIDLIDRPFRPDDLDGAVLAYGAHGDPALDRAVSAAARARGVAVNVVDGPEQSDFITPAIVDRDPVTVAIGTEGAAPVLARMIKARIEATLPSGLGRVAAVAAGLRDRVARQLRDGAPRRRFWRLLFEAGWGEKPASVAALAENLLADRPLEPAGKVWLVGAGPGDPELMTLKARRILDGADVVVHDRLVDQPVLELARREARFIPVGKTPGVSSISQSEINDILVAEASAGHRVVRLKGGDPLIFGRADEEMAALHAAGIEVEIVPGITAASAAAAAAKISLTRRARNQAVALITARGSDGPAEHDWRALAADGSAFAVYMGVGQARFLQGRLLLHGARSETPVTVVENASRPDERIVWGTLAQLPALIGENGITGPAVLLIGLSPAQQGAMALGAPGLTSRGAA
jgi:uroporphyrin-III C-methyltransferase/precorrin-2 dehydrogenase/sirohydrochlorin ferrochelatase